MTKAELQQVAEIFEKCGWELDVEHNMAYLNIVEEDYFIDLDLSGDRDSLREQIENWCNGFDPEEHVIDWAIAKREGVEAPSIFFICEEAKKIEDALDELMMAI